MRTGLWLIGARGSVAVTSITGALAVRGSLAAPTGMVTELPALRNPFIPALSDLYFGGHDLAPVALCKKAHDLAAGGVLPVPLVSAVADELNSIDASIQPVPSGRAQADIAARVTDDLNDFRSRLGLDHVVVLNVSSTEAAQGFDGSLEDLRVSLDHGSPLSWSSLYAYAAMSAGCSYVDFTPSTGARIPALHSLSVQNGVPYAGHDGKTGETLLKSVLAPMFSMRNLQVRSWSGTNLLGGGDGANLAEPAANASKVVSKQRVLREILGYEPEGHTRIDYVPDIGDLKTAWDLITFNGFLSTRMRLEFTWHGCDSALAAPLVLDLARLTAAAHQLGRSGPLRELAFFFKDPIGTVPHGLSEQWNLLCNWVSGWPHAS